MNTLEQETAALWGNRLGASPDLLLSPGVHLLFRGAPHRPNRLILYHRTNTTNLIVLPDHLQARADLPFDVLRQSDVSVEAVMSILPMLAPRLLWRDFVYYQTPDRITIPRRDCVRLLTPADASALDALHTACSREEWQLARIAIADPAVSGCFADGLLVGAASLLYVDEHPRAADIGVLTHPAYRGQGIAAALIPPLADFCRERGLLMQYMTQEGNIGSIRTAEKAGFILWLVEEGLVIGEA